MLIKFNEELNLLREGLTAPSQTQPAQSRPLRWAYFSRREGRGWGEAEHQKNGPLESCHLLKTQQSQGTRNLAQKEPDVLLSTRDDVITAVPESGPGREYDKDAFEMGFGRDSYLSAGGKSASDDHTLCDLTPTPSPHPNPNPGACYMIFGSCPISELLHPVPSWTFWDSFGSDTFRLELGWKVKCSCVTPLTLDPTISILHNTFLGMVTEGCSVAFKTFPDWRNLNFFLPPGLRAHRSHVTSQRLALKGALIFQFRPLYFNHFPPRIHITCRREEIVMGGGGLRAAVFWAQSVTLQESSWRRLRYEPLDVSDPCRWSRITSLWSTLTLEWKATTLARTPPVSPTADCVPHGAVQREAARHHVGPPRSWTPAWHKSPSFYSASKTAIWQL